MHALRVVSGSHHESVPCLTAELKVLYKSSSESILDLLDSPSVLTASKTILVFSRIFPAWDCKDTEHEKSKV